MRKYLTEFIGTFFLVLTICLVVITNQRLGPLAIGSALMIMVYMGGHISGGHYNPAVSLAVLLRGKLAAADFLPYLLAQAVGALVAAACAQAITGKTMAPAPGSDVPVLSALLVEFLFTFALALVVLNVATSAKTEGNSYYGLAIGFTVVVGAIAGGSISGGAYNPAVGFGPIVVDTIAGHGNMANLWLYLVGPFAGGAAAACVFMIQEGIVGTERTAQADRGLAPASRG